MRSEYPRVTVIMAVYNGEEYLRESIGSVLSQTFTDFEFLIINDGSTDGSLDIIESYGDPRIKLIHNDTNLGLVATRNKGLANAGGEYIAWLDCDDIAYPTRLAEQAAFMDSHPAYGMIGSWVEIIDESGKPNGEIWKYDAPAESIPSTLLFNNYFAQSSVFIRKRDLPEVWYRPDFPGTEDFDLWVRMTAYTKVWNLPRVLIKYRVHSTSISFVRASDIEECVQKIILYQLNNLGIEPTPDELGIHRSLGKWEFRASKEYVKDVETWLYKLLEAIDRAQCYDPQCFRQVIAERWFYACSAAGILGLWVLNRYWQSPLSRNTGISGLRKFRFSARTCLGWK